VAGERKEAGWGYPQIPAGRSLHPSFLENEKMKKTYSAKAAELDPQWYVIDAEGQVLGRLASQIAQILRGKHKPTYTPHMPCGDFVVVINADKIAVTGRRLDQKIYYRHSQYPGGLKKATLRQTLEGRFPERALQHAVRGMVMHNRLGAVLMDHLKIYAGAEHPHAAQKPVTWTGPEALLKKPVQTTETTDAVSAEDAE